jgi:hypothetical protein
MRGLAVFPRTKASFTITNMDIFIKKQREYPDWIAAFGFAGGLPD